VVGRGDPAHQALGRAVMVVVVMVVGVIVPVRMVVVVDYGAHLAFSIWSISFCP
jgi:hypothetical protein